MQPDFFESSTFSLILAWLGAAGVFASVISTLLFTVQKYKGVPWALSFWIGACIILISPLRYIFFQVCLAFSYPLQSLSAFFLSVPMSLLFVPVFGVIYLFTIGGPVSVVVALLDKESKITFMRGVMASILVPVACYISSALFYWGLTFTGDAFGWMFNPKDLIKATNGPAAVIYKYVASPFMPTIVPAIYSDTPQEDIDLLRCHVASTYLNNKKFGYFVKHQYPEIYEKGPR